jgi:hypothetical protein
MENELTKPAVALRWAITLGWAMLVPYAQERMSFLKSNKTSLSGSPRVNSRMLIL